MRVRGRVAVLSNCESLACSRTVGQVLTATHYDGNGPGRLRLDLSRVFGLADAAWHRDQSLRVQGRLVVA